MVFLFLVLFHLQSREPAVLFKARERLSNSLDPPYKHLLKDIGHLEEGIKMLVNMRKDLLVSGFYFIFAYLIACSLQQHSSFNFALVNFQ